MVARGQAALGLVSSTGEAADAAVLYALACLRSPAALAVFRHYGFQSRP